MICRRHTVTRPWPHRCWRSRAQPGIFLFLITSLLDTCALREVLRHLIERVAQRPARTDLGGSPSTGHPQQAEKPRRSSLLLSVYELKKELVKTPCSVALPVLYRTATLPDCYSTGLRTSLEIMKPDLQKTKKFVFCTWEFSNCPRPCHQLTRKNSMETGIYQGAGFMMI